MIKVLADIHSKLPETQLRLESTKKVILVNEDKPKARRNKVNKRYKSQSFRYIKSHLTFQANT